MVSGAVRPGPDPKASSGKGSLHCGEGPVKRSTPIEDGPQIQRQASF